VTVRSTTLSWTEDARPRTRLRTTPAPMAAIDGHRQPSWDRRATRARLFEPFLFFTTKEHGKGTDVVSRSCTESSTSGGISPVSERPWPRGELRHSPASVGSGRFSAVLALHDKSFTSSASVISRCVCASTIELVITRPVVKKVAPARPGKRPIRRGPARRSRRNVVQVSVVLFRPPGHSSRRVATNIRGKTVKAQPRRESSAR